jgi:hypothetical protein
MFVAAALLLALISIVLTRGFRAFTAAEIAAVLAFLAGAALWWAPGESHGIARLGWPEKLIVAGSFIGLGGLVIKLVFFTRGIGVVEHGMANHAMEPAPAGPNPLLQHIHHLFFNLGFLLFLFAAIGMMVRRLRSSE